MFFAPVAVIGRLHAAIRRLAPGLGNNPSVGTIILVPSFPDPATLVIPEYYSERERFVLQYGIDISKQNLEHPERLQHETRIDSMAFGPYRLVFAQNELFSEYNTPLDPAKAVLICYSHGYGRYIAGPSFDGMTYESLQDTLSDESRQALLDAIGEAGCTE